MSSTLETLQRQIDSGQDLSSIVRTMKALAATSVRQYEKAAEALDEYYHTVELGLSVALSSPGTDTSQPAPAANRPVMMLVFGSDHGLAGRFNEQIVYHALQSRRNQAGPGGAGGEENGPFKYLLAAVGEQVISRLEAENTDVAHGFNMPGSISAITPFIQGLLEMIEKRRSEDGVEQVLLFYNRPLAGSFKPGSERLLPVDLEGLKKTRLSWQSRSLPTYSLPQGSLLSALLRQYFFVSLYRACALSLAAENTSRLAAMQAAEKNINERLGQLRTAYQHERQAAITGELLDIISGFRAVGGSSA